MSLLSFCYYNVLLDFDWRDIAEELGMPFRELMKQLALIEIMIEAEYLDEDED